MGNLISTATLLNDRVNFKELKLADYRGLLKCFLGNDIDSEFIFNNINAILQKVTDLTYSEITNLNTVDYFLLLFQIRQISIGDTVFLHVENDLHKQLKIDLRIQSLIDEINNTDFLQLLEPDKTDIGYIYYQIPSVQEILYLEKNVDSFVYTFFLKRVEFSNISINLENFSYIERESIVQKLPVKIISLLTKRVQKFIEVFNSINLLRPLNSDSFTQTVPFVLNSQLLGFVLKLIYNSSLEYIYDSMFALSKMANFSGSFLDNCTPGEFFFFVKKLELLNAQQAAAQSAGDNSLPITSESSLAEFDVE